MTSPQPVTNEAFAKFKARRASDVKYGVNILIYGQGGVGKSSFAATAADSPYGSPCLFLDAEGGSRAIAHRDDITVIDIKTWLELEDFTKVAGKALELPWKTVVMDNCSEFINLLTKQVVGTDESAPTQPQWGKMAMEFLSFIRDWRNIGTRTGTNIVFIAWDDEEKDEIGRSKHQLQMTPKLKREIPGMVDIIGFMSVNEKSGTEYRRIIDFAPSSKTVSKFRRSQTEAALEIPYRIEYGLKDSPLADMLAVLKGGEKWPSEKYAKYSKSRE